MEHVLYGIAAIGLIWLFETAWANSKKTKDLEARLTRLENALGAIVDQELIKQTALLKTMSRRDDEIATANGEHRLPRAVAARAPGNQGRSG